ncbi:MAG TPA: methionine--tRNA ligase, partial [Saprospiraceae bacterium]|nr:methionine--tRNA ligase [Saprospiraceae bacterium]
PAEHLFSRIPDEVIEREVAKLAATAEPAPAPTAAGEGENRPTAQAAQGTGEKSAPAGTVDIRTGTILTAERLQKSKKLLKLSVDLGFEQRTILAGIAEHYSPEEVVGKQVIVLASLAPRMMMGVESQGMILMAEGEGGNLGFVSPPAGWANGMSVR